MVEYIIVSYYNLDLSVRLSANYSAVFGPIDPKLGRKVWDRTEQNLRALVSMATIPLPRYSIKTVLYP